MITITVGSDSEGDLLLSKCTIKVQKFQKNALSQCNN